MALCESGSKAPSVTRFKIRKEERTRGSDWLPGQSKQREREGHDRKSNENE